MLSVIPVQDSMMLPPNDSSKKYSIIYRNLLTYRLVLNILFFGKYKQRFKKVISLLDPKKDKKIVELCFGDVYIAEWCNEQGVDYVGLDVNPYFVSGAEKKGYCVKLVNLRTEQTIPSGDVVIMMGSLYHFHDILQELVDRIMQSCSRFIISEPIKNWSSRKDILGRIAKNCANAGQGEEVFRYTESTLLEALEQVSDGKYNISHTISGKEAIVEISWAK